ncbi:MAG: hypothetical protein QG602_3578 [Verrucomicrobiota bacterium]|nr:hypothetical protein [Verrucomicrobiota bacterium]
MTAVSDETGRDWLPLKYEDGPDFCTVTFATGAAFALTVHPERMKLMEAALSASPVAQEPVARLCGYCKTWNSKPCGEQCYLQPNDPVWTSPPATPAGTPANRGDRVIYWLKRYQADEHLDDDACEELDALINVLSKGVKVQPSAGVGADEIAQIIATKCFDPRVIDSSGKPFWKKSQWREAQQAANAILLLLSGGRSEQERSQMEGSL